MAPPPETARILAPPPADRALAGRHPDRSIRSARSREARPYGRGTCLLLHEDPELAEAISAPWRAEAIKACRAHELRISPGQWNINDGAEGHGGIGLLVLEGFLVSRVTVGGRSCAELLGAGDLIAPSRHYGGPPITEPGAVLASLRVAVLDAGFTDRQLAAHPELAAALVERAARRASNLAVSLAIIQRPRVAERLHLTLWQLAMRWGRVRADGVLLPLRLTHQLLAELVAARRPTVTSSLSDLAGRGLLCRTREGWALSWVGVDDLGDQGVLHTPHGHAITRAHNHRR